MSRRSLDQEIDIVGLMCRVDFLSFIRKCFHTLSPNSEFLPNWHIDRLAYELDLVRLGQNPRLVINAPPRMLKSLICSIALPAYILGHDPSKRVIVVSYGTDLAIKLANDFRMIVNSAWYKEMFPGMCISRAKNTEFEVVTTQNGYRLAASIDGALTGRGGDIIIVDDPLKGAIDANSDAKRDRVNYLFTSTVMTRLDNKQTGTIILVMQRWHPDDLAGRLQRTPNEWKTLSFPAIAERDEEIRLCNNRHHRRRVGDVLHPQLEPRTVLEQIRSQMPFEDFAAQYQQAPVPPGGTMIKREKVHRYEKLPYLTSSSKRVQSWDTASKEKELSDYSVCTTWLYQDGRYYLVHVLRGRFGYHDLKIRAIDHARAYRANLVLVEEANVGGALVSELKNAGLRAIAVTPQESKRTRMFIQAGKFENGTALLPKQAPWLAELEDELFAFPYVRHDDQVDSISQALAYEPDHYDPAAITRGMDAFLAGYLFG